MELDSIKPNDSIRVEIDFPYEEGDKPFVFILSGPSHPATRKAEKAQADALMSMRRKGSGEQAQAAMSQFVANRVIGWENVDATKGVPLEFTPENALKVIENKNLSFIRQQLMAALGDDELLYKSSRG